MAGGFNMMISSLLHTLKITEILEPHYYSSVYKFFKSLEDQGVIFKEEDVFYIQKLLVPERIFTFQIPWEDDQGHLHVNTGYRVQHNGALGLYKGGLRFHPSVNLDIIKALAFEQTFKNALTGYPMGGAKGGSNFNPKGRSKRDIRRFSYAFMEALAPYIGEHVDIPAGDLGIDGDILGYMNAKYQNLKQESLYPLTGKPVLLNGSFIRKEATGFGLIYFIDAFYQEVLKDSIQGKTILISGAGNVGIHAALKASSLGGIVVGISDSSGYVYDPQGLNIPEIIDHKVTNSQPLETYHNQSIVYKDDMFWHHPCEIALPCAKEDDIGLEDIKVLHKYGVKVVAEGANIAVKSEAIQYMKENKIMYGPGKAANAGGVFVSALEIEQNRTFHQWHPDVVDQKLKDLMKQLFHDMYVQANEKHYELMGAANQLAFVRILQAMKLRGLC